MVIVVPNKTWVIIKYLKQIYMNDIIGAVLYF